MYFLVFAFSIVLCYPVYVVHFHLFVIYYCYYVCVIIHTCVVPKEDAWCPLILHLIPLKHHLLLNLLWGGSPGHRPIVTTCSAEVTGTSSTQLFLTVVLGI